MKLRNEVLSKRSTAVRFILLAITLLSLAGASLAQSGKKSTIHSFNPANDGTYPTGRLTFDKSGALYGTTDNSVTFNECQFDGGECGLIYKLSPPLWKETILYAFGDDANDGGGNPYDGVVFDQAGNIYGSDHYAIFQLTPLVGGGVPWNFAAAYTDDLSPTLSLPLPDASGNLFFTSYSNLSNGTIVQLTPQGSGTWSSTTLFTFNGGTDGSGPADGLISDKKGNLYGTTITSQVNANFCGTVYNLTPDSTRTVWTHTTLHTFSGPDGCGGSLLPMIFDSKGNLYGASPSGGSGTSCTSGCGVVFELSPPITKGGSWQLSVLYSFLGGSDGSVPQGLAMDGTGTLYGVTIQGGTGRCVINNQSVGCGTIYKLTPSSGGGAWTKTILHSFLGGKDGGQPYGGVTIGPDGALYGTTSLWGEFSGGNVFRIPR